jgi:hypothetical protein
MTVPSPSDPAAILRREHHGVLVVAASSGDWTTPIRFIIDGKAGMLVAPVTTPLGEAESVVLFVPDESDRSLQVHVSPRAIPDWRGSEACDRWLAYFGRPEGSTWYTLEPMGYRLGALAQDSGGLVFDADEVNLVNPLHIAEGRLCKMANADRTPLGRLAARKTGDPAPGALCVGVDPRGFDIRVALGILRVDFDSPAGDEGAAAEALRAALTT